MRKEIYRISPDEELTDAKLSKFIMRHAAESTFRYKQLQDAYETDFPIFHESKKPEWKPDNRIAVNFAKYIVDTMNGYFIGNPVKITVDGGEESIEKYVEFLDQYNDQDDNNAELSKICSIYGKGYEMYYNDEDGNVGIIYLDPTEAFMIYDDSVLKRERYFVRLYRDEDDVLHGSVSDQEKVRWFTIKGKIVWDDQEQLHYFDGVPATEYRENKECQGIFEPVLSIINAFNKAISEKANDVDYFADAYLKIIGTLLDEDELKHVRSDRVINFDGDGESVIVDFLQKPNGDTTQENLLDRLQNLIFLIAMVANISDENFGTSSGIAMAYKLQGMSNLRKTKERKFTSGMNRRYKLIFSNPGNTMQKDDWVKLHYKFTPNVPANLLEESQIAQNLSGVVSQETQLGVLSVVDNPRAEIERIEKEEEKPKDAVMQQMFGDKVNEQ
ncbi:phage portal protein [Anaerostipes sp. Marseille-Q3525]|uniref:phage portal protein n=1 Tax=Anaerostipes sp. Marseille-Q3525 TaxID=2758418 RepID=UPI001BA4FE1F|nr:phage portal protein [Anaerostipes sp. Marseille-Q3525]MBR9961934.1 phage portal protein [Anaerostipes sp. Marseille-Q3525]DAQ09568.1 MAG TPA: PORTAL PROTEIN [Caudoviricetes sp.]